MTWEETHEKAIAKVQAELEAGDFEATIAKHAKSITRLEIIWRAAERALGDSPNAGRAGELFFELKALHRKADVLAAELANQPMPRSGDR